MEKGYAYNSSNPTHPNLDFVGKISPFCENETCCSCVLISPGHILTAWHCLTSPCGDFCIQFPKGRKNNIKEFQRIGRSDIAVASLEKLENIKPISLAPMPMKIGQFTILAGYGVNQGRFDLRFGFAKVTKLFGDKILCDDQNSLSPIATSGDSGGPVLAHNGKDIFVAGIISKSYNDSCCISTYFQEILSYCFLSNRMKKDRFNELCYFETGRRGLVENGFASDQTDDWIDIDNWLTKQIDNRSKDNGLV